VQTTNLHRSQPKSLSEPKGIKKGRLYLSIYPLQRVQNRALSSLGITSTPKLQPLPTVTRTSLSKKATMKSWFSLVASNLLNKKRKSEVEIKIKSVLKRSA
jgi:hypothetical protein